MLRPSAPPAGRARRADRRMLHSAHPFAPATPIPMPAWFPAAPWYVLTAVPLVIATAYVVFGATGFGSSIIAVPVLAHWFPLTFAVPLVTTLDCAATINASTRQWRRADFTEFRRILPSMLVG